MRSWFASHRDSHFTSIRLKAKRFLEMGNLTLSASLSHPYRTWIYPRWTSAHQGQRLHICGSFCEAGSQVRQVRVMPYLDLTFVQLHKWWNIQISHQLRENCPCQGQVLSISQTGWHRASSHIPQWSNPRLWCVKASTSPSLLLLMSQSGSISTCQPLQTFL